MRVCVSRAGTTALPHARAPLHRRMQAKHSAHEGTQAGVPSCQCVSQAPPHTHMHRGSAATGSRVSSAAAAWRHAVGQSITPTTALSECGSLAVPVPVCGCAVNMAFNNMSLLSISLSLNQVIRQARQQQASHSHPMHACSHLPPTYLMPPGGQRCGRGVCNRAPCRPQLPTHPR